MDKFIGEIFDFAGDYAPAGSRKCDGTTLNIIDYPALFDVIGNTYGGDGTTTFALPDFRGRSSVGTGEGPGLTAFAIGQFAGTESKTLTSGNLPAHVHGIKPPADSGSAGNTDPVNCYPGNDSENGVYSNGHDGLMAQYNTQATGGGESFSIRNPVLAITKCICVDGIVPEA